MTKRERCSQITAFFERTMPEAQSELHYRSPFELLVAVVLSAQCTDKRVNQITPLLFAKYPTAERLSAATVEEVLPYIRSVSYPNSKAKYLVLMSRELMLRFGGAVPQTVAALESLTGVGRKTANVVASVCFGVAAIAVDTHVFRVAARLGLSAGAKTPMETELMLQQCFPKGKWSVAHHWLILHGRYVCTAKSPKCTQCGLLSCCLTPQNNPDGQRA